MHIDMPLTEPLYPKPLLTIPNSTNNNNITITKAYTDTNQIETIYYALYIPINEHIQLPPTSEFHNPTTDNIYLFTIQKQKILEFLYHL